MSIEEIEREIHDAYVRLAESAAAVRYSREHYLDKRSGEGGMGERSGRVACGPCGS